MTRRSSTRRIRRFWISRFRQAIAHAIDKETLVERVYSGIGTPGTTMSPSANPAWIPELSAEDTYDFDLEKSKQILEDAGYTDSNGDGIREYEGENIVLRYAIRTESEYSKPYAEFITGWLKEIGIDTTSKSYDDGQLIEVAGKGDFDLYVWGWTPFVDPDPMLSYFQCSQVSVDASDFSNYYNDTGICDPEYDALYKQQNTELDPDKRETIVHDMLTRFYKGVGYVVLDTTPDLQAHRTDRFEGWVRQPAEIGPVLFSNSSPSYWNLTPIARCGRRRRVVVERADRDRRRRRDRHRARRAGTSSDGEAQGSASSGHDATSRTELDP